MLPKTCVGLVSLTRTRSLLKARGEPKEGAPRRNPVCWLRGFLFVCYPQPPNLVRLCMDEKRFERDAAETRRKKAMLYLAALLAVLLLIGFLL